jgi:hypothetical protein
LADCGNLKFPDLNCTDFGEKTLNFTDFGEKKQVLAMFYVLFVRKNFFDPNLLRGGSPEKSPTFLGKIWKKIWKNWKKYGKIWHRGNFSPNVISETGCGNFP